MYESKSFWNQKNERFPWDRYPGANLNPTQRHWAEVRQSLRSILNGKNGFPFLPLLIRPAAAQKNRLQPITSFNLVRSPQSLRVCTIVPIRQEVRPVWRMEVLDQGMYLDEGGRLAVGPEVDYWVYDYLKLPHSPHQRYQLKQFKTGSVGDLLGLQDRDLYSPIGGDFRLVRDALYVNFVVGGAVVYRFDNDAAKCYEPSGRERFVRKGEKLVHLTANCSYMEAMFRQDGKPKWDSGSNAQLPGGDPSPLLHGCNEALDRAVRLIQDPVTWCADWDSNAPVAVAVLSAADFRNRRQLGWQPSLHFQEELRLACSYQARVNKEFKVRSSVTAKFLGFKRENNSLVLEFLSRDGKVTTDRLPHTATLSIEKGRVVSVGEPIGDWVPRGSAPDYGGLESLADSHISWLEDEFLQQSVLKCGEHGWHGEGVAVDARLLGPLADRAIDWLVDLRPCQEFLDERYGQIILTLPYSQQSTSVSCHGITYNFAPYEEPVTRPTPVADQQLVR